MPAGGADDVRPGIGALKRFQRFGAVFDRWSQDPDGDDASATLRFDHIEARAAARTLHLRDRLAGVGFHC